jgi:hypothetical protein
MCIEEKIQMDGQKKFVEHITTKWMIVFEMMWCLRHGK